MRSPRSAPSTPRGGHGGRPHSSPTHRSGGGPGAAPPQALAGAGAQSQPPRGPALSVRGQRAPSTGGAREALLALMEQLRPAAGPPRGGAPIGLTASTAAAGGYRVVSVAAPPRASAAAAGGHPTSAFAGAAAAAAAAFALDSPRARASGGGGCGTASNLSARPSVNVAAEAAAAAAQRLGRAAAAVGARHAGPAVAHSPRSAARRLSSGPSPRDGFGVEAGSAAGGILAWAGVGAGGAAEGGLPGSGEAAGLTDAGGAGGEEAPPPPGSARGGPAELWLRTRSSVADAMGSPRAGAASPRDAGGRGGVAASVSGAWLSPRPSTAPGPASPRPSDAAPSPFAPPQQLYLRAAEEEAAAAAAAKAAARAACTPSPLQPPSPSGPSNSPLGVPKLDLTRLWRAASRRSVAFGLLGTRDGGEDSEGSERLSPDGGAANPGSSPPRRSSSRSPSRRQLVWAGEQGPEDAASPLGARERSVTAGGEGGARISSVVPIEAGDSDGSDGEGPRGGGESEAGGSPRHAESQA
jgi:hypothetical protein